MVFFKAYAGALIAFLVIVLLTVVVIGLLRRMEIGR